MRAPDEATNAFEIEDLVHILADSKFQSKRTSRTTDFGDAGQLQDSDRSL